MTTPATPTPPSAPAPSASGTPAPTQPSSAPGWAWAVVVIGLIVLLILTLFRSCSDDKPKTPPASESSAPSAKTVEIPEPTPRFEEVTPCSTYIDYRCQIKGDGADFFIRFPGVKDPVPYSRGKYTAPEGAEEGMVFFEAADPSRPVRIRVFRKVLVTVPAE